MSDKRGPSQVPEIVLVSGRTSARFDGSRLLITRGRTSWTLPVKALSAAKLRARGTVVIAISGPAAAARHGLGPAVALRAPNARAARAFASAVSRALPARPAEDGHALVEVHTGPRRRYLPTPRRPSRTTVITSALGAYVLLLAAWARFGPPPAGSVVVGGVLLPIGLFTLWRTALRLRSLWLLRVRGIRVTGTALETDEQALWTFPPLRFTTVDGRRMKDIISVTSTLLCFTPLFYEDQDVEVVYDPEHPERAGLPVSFGFVLRTLFLIAAGAASMNLGISALLGLPAVTTAIEAVLRWLSDSGYAY